MMATTTTLLKRTSTATYIGEQGKPPVITTGKLTADLLFDFENGTFSYFSFIGFCMGIPWVRFSHTAPIPAKTVTRGG